MNREDWLTKATTRLTPIVGNLPKVRMSCGFPRGGRKGQRIGECWSSKASADGTHEIFICPSLSDGVRVLDVLVHELIHAVVGCEAGHKGPFRRLATKVGLTGKMTATVAGAELKAKLVKLADSLGPYPHATLNAALSGRKKQGTRMRKVVCPSKECGYTVRTTAKWLEVGTPTCPCGEEMRAEEAEEEGE